MALSNPRGTYPINGSVKGSAIMFGAVGAGATYTGSVSGTSMSGRYKTGEAEARGALARRDGESSWGSERVSPRDATIAVMDVPDVRYARSGDVDIAYQVVGEGPRTLVFVQGWVSNIEWAWQEPSLARFLRRLASFSRLIMFDKRGTGLSDRVAVDDLPTME